LTTHLTTRADSEVDWLSRAWDQTGYKTYKFSNPAFKLLSMHTLLSLFFSMLTPRFAVIAPISYTMANIYNYASILSKCIYSLMTLRLSSSCSHHWHDTCIYTMMFCRSAAGPIPSECVFECVFLSRIRLCSLPVTD
jgi:hypothetical protein